MDGSQDPLPRRIADAGTVLFQQGEPGDCLYVIQRGRVGIYKELENGRRRLIGELEVGDLFGEMALVDGKPRMATALALEECQLVVVPGEAFRHHLKKSSPFIRSVLTVLVNNLRRVDYDGSGAPDIIEEGPGLPSAQATSIPENPPQIIDSPATTIALQSRPTVRELETEDEPF